METSKKSEYKRSDVKRSPQAKRTTLDRKAIRSIKYAVSA